MPRRGSKPASTTKTRLVRIRPVATIVGLAARLTGWKHRIVLVHQNAVAVTFQIVVLPMPDGPNENTDQYESEEYHAGDQCVDYFHRFLPQCDFTIGGPSSFRSTNTRGRRKEGMHESPSEADHLNNVRIRAALPITNKELMGMEIAATNGVITAIIASGTIITL